MNCEEVLQSVDLFLQMGMYESAERLASFLHSQLNPSCYTSSIEVQNLRKDTTTRYFLPVLVKLGDACMSQKEFHRALAYFQQAKEYLKYQAYHHLPPSSSSDGNSRTASKTSSSFSSMQLVLKMAKCHNEMSQFDTARELLETISWAEHDLQSLTLLGSLYCKLHLYDKAKQTYLILLSLVPTSIPTIEQLIQLGVHENELMECVMHGVEFHAMKFTCCDPKFDFQSNTWVSMIIKSLCSEREAKYEQSFSSLGTLLTTLFPMNGWILATKGRIQVRQEMYDSALTTFRQLRRLEPSRASGLADYARCLYHMKNETELAKLTSDLLHIAPYRPEGWLSAATFALMVKNTPNTLSFADKALLIDSRCALAHKLKALAYIEEENHTAALESYSLANTIHADVESFVGMVEQNIVLGKLKDAASVGKLLVTSHPVACESYFILGNLLQHYQGPSDRGNSLSSAQCENCIRSYRKALRLQPRYKKATISLATLYLSTNCIDQAIQTLEAAINLNSADPDLLYMMALAQKENGALQTAVELLERCIRLKLPTDDATEAHEELVAVEALMKSIANEHEDDMMMH